MPLKFAFRACCLAGIVLVAAVAAERKPSLLGATRDEVVARFGEPKSNIVAGNREVLFFTGERVVLRNDRVVEVEEIPVEIAPLPKPAAPAVPAPAPTDVTPDSAAPASHSPAARSSADPAASNQKTVGAAGSAVAADGAAPATTDTAPVPPPEPQVFIKSVRPPSKSGAPTASASAPAPTPHPSESLPPAPVPPLATVAAAPTSSAPAQPVVAEPTPTRSEPAPADSAATPSVGETSPVASAPTEARTDASVLVAAAAPTVPSEGTSTPSAEATVASSSSTSDVAAPVKPANVTAKPVTVPKAVRAEPAPETEATGYFTTQTYVIACVILVGGIGYLIWRRRQQSLMLEATAVSNSPFVPPTAAAASGARFTQDLLNKLEWKRFEELVAAYYNKTGVVASRTKSGPASAVHIRISWKGEQRPFACVQCLPHPSGLIDAKPIQALCEVIAAEDIRRGYVVSAGKFGVPARDIAEEKNITLLSGDIFLEKLNALPDPARAELIKDATAGDYITPSCPTCDTKMGRSPSDPTVWQCPQCGATLPKV